jgi:hypothetical protein
MILNVTIQLGIISLLTETVECFYLNIYSKTLELTTLISDQLTFFHINFQPNVLDIALSKQCIPSKPLSVPALSFDHNPVLFKILLRPSFSEPLPILDYMLANCPLLRSTLDQLILTNPRIRDRTGIEHRSKTSTLQCVKLHFQPFPISPSGAISLLYSWSGQSHDTQKTTTDGAIKDQDSACFISSTNFPPMFSLSDRLNYEILNGHYTPKQNHFGKSPGTSRHIYDLFLPYLTTVCRSSILPIQPIS